MSTKPAWLGSGDPRPCPHQVPGGAPGQTASAGHFSHLQPRSPNPVHPQSRKMTPVSPSSTPAPPLRPQDGTPSPAGWTVQGLVSVRRAPHFEGTPSPCDRVKSRVGMFAGPETAPREGLAPEPMTSPSAPTLGPGAAQRGVTLPLMCSLVHSIVHPLIQQVRRRRGEDGPPERQLRG